MAEVIEPSLKETAVFNAGTLQELKRLKFRVRRRISADLSGGYRTAFRGSGLQFRDLRQYEPGDDIRSIQWKASARTGITYVKTYDEERHLRFHLVVDVSRSTAAGFRSPIREQVGEFAALICLLAQVHQDSVGLTLFSNTVEVTIPARQRRNHTDRVLAEILTPRELRPATDIGSVLNFLRTREHHRSIVFVISDFFTGDFQPELKLLSHRHDVIAALCGQPQEESLPRAGLATVTDAESGRQILIDTSSARAREAYFASQRIRSDELERKITACGAEFLSISRSPFEALRTLLRRRMKGIR